ncbi:MAG TPA: efflux RND transporter periplasmic adaptor subunit [Patescibacteria group bacterium]|nr:efflux RND transporter periplasmic adaptor subunit [Patescibacteria group bacterium]
MINRIKNVILSHKRIAVVLALIIIAVFVFTRSRSGANKVTYETATATRGTLISSVTASGTIVATNNIDVTSTANGQVNKVYVKEGDQVTKGQKLFNITLDATGQQREAQAYSSYLSAQNSVTSANASYYTLQASEFSANQKFINDAVARGLATTDPTYIQENDAWLAAQSNFNNAQNSISSAQANLTNASIAYQQASSTIVAPVSGTIQNITVVPGMAITNSTTTSSSGNSTSSVTVASVETPGNPVATVSIAEADVDKVKAGQKVTLTFDSIANQTFTGVVAGINKLGTTSSGVTNYPATIQFDSGSDSILPNMTVEASIITDIKDNVITVPTSAITTQGGNKVVRELKNGQLDFVPITIGEASDTDTEIDSGVNEGDTVVTAIINPSASTSTGNTTSPFSGNRGGVGGFGGAAGGGNVRVFTRGG